MSIESEAEALGRALQAATDAGSSPIRYGRVRHVNSSFERRGMVSTRTVTSVQVDGIQDLDTQDLHRWSSAFQNDLDADLVVEGSLVEVHYGNGPGVIAYRVIGGYNG